MIFTTLNLIRFRKDLGELAMAETIKIHVDDHQKRAYTGRTMDVQWAIQFNSIQHFISLNSEDIV